MRRFALLVTHSVKISHQTKVKSIYFAFLYSFPPNSRTNYFVQHICPTFFFNPPKNKALTKNLVMLNFSQLARVELRKNVYFTTTKMFEIFQCWHSWIETKLTGCLQGCILRISITTLIGDAAGEAKFLFSNK